MKSSKAMATTCPSNPMRKDYLAYLMAFALLSVLYGVARASEPQPHALSIADGQTAIDEVYALVTDIVVPQLDIPRIARIVLGKQARQVSSL